MNPELEELKKRVTQLEEVSNLDEYESFLQLLIKDNPDVEDLDVDLEQTIAVVGGGGGSVTFSTVDYPDKWLVIRYRGELYRVPAYLKKLDSAR